MNFIDAHDFSVGLLIRVLGIAASTYYGWRKARQQPSRRTREDAGLLTLIDKIRGSHEFAATYGSPRVWLELHRRGVWVSRKRVERIMRVHPPRRLSAQGLEVRVHPAKPQAHGRAGSARPRLHRDCTQPQVGGRSDSHPTGEGGVAGQRS